MRSNDMLPFNYTSGVMAAGTISLEYCESSCLYAD